MYRFHIVGLPHIPSSRRYPYCACAYNGSKVFYLNKMLMDLGHEVYYYGVESSDCPATEIIPTLSLEETKTIWGENDDSKKFFAIKWNNDHVGWQVSNGRAVAEIKKRYQPKDFVCLIGGNCHSAVLDGVSGLKVIVTEPSIGYGGVMNNTHHCYESSTHQAKVAGQRHSDPDGRYMDTVIPCYINPDDFTFCDQKSDYLLFFARLIKRKGLLEAVQVANELGKKLLICGQGALEYKNDYPNSTLRCEELSIQGRFEFLGSKGVEERNVLMGNARVLIQPTHFYGPGENTAIEAQACGTPGIYTPWGCYISTVEHGKTGYLCHSLGQMCEAYEQAQYLDYQYIRDRAVERHSIHNIKHYFQAWFDLLYDLHDQGFYSKRKWGEQLKYAFWQ